MWSKEDFSGGGWWGIDAEVGIAGMEKNVPVWLGRNCYRTLRWEVCN